MMLGAFGCGDDAADETGGTGGTGGSGAGGTGGTGGMMVADPDRFPWTMAVSIVQIDAVSAGSVFDIDDWCDADNRGEFFAQYLLDPPGPEGATTLLDLDFDAGGPEDSRLYGDDVRRTFTVSSASETARVSSANSFENDGIVDDELSDFSFMLENIPPSLIDFTDDVGCAEFGYEGSVGRNDCSGGCVLTASNRAKSLCFLEVTFCIQNISPPDR